MCIDVVPGSGPNQGWRVENRNRLVTFCKQDYHAQMAATGEKKGHQEEICNRLMTWKHTVWSAIEDNWWSAESMYGVCVYRG